MFRFLKSPAFLGLGLLSALAVALLAAPPANAQPAAATIDILVGNEWFCKRSFEGQVCQTNLTAGETVRWTLTEGNHTVTQCSDASFSTCPPPGGFDSGLLVEGGGQTYSQTFNTAGIIYYRCNIHPVKMRGQLNVTATPAPMPTPTPTPTATATLTPAVLAATATPAPSATPTPAVLGFPPTGSEGGGGSGSAQWLIGIAVGGVLALLAAHSVIRTRRQRPTRCSR